MKQREQQADQIRIDQLHELVLSKEKQINQLQNYQKWLQDQNDEMLKNQQLIMEEQSNRDKEISKQKQSILVLEQQLSTAEAQLHKSLQNQSLLEKENCNLKTKLMDIEKKIYQQELDEAVRLKQIEDFKNEQMEYHNKVTQFSMCLEQQDAYICKLEKDLQLSRKSSKENIQKQYKSVVLREKSPNNYDPNQLQKFVTCIVEMVVSCSPQYKQKPSLKKCWKWLKAILEEYMAMKKQLCFNFKADSTKSSQYVGPKRESGFLNEINKRFQTSVDDYENKSFRSNTLLTKTSK
ncbi:hypothetical protein pb186bvf_012369 [Paramecium bursaria]